MQNSDDLTEERDSGLESFSMLDTPEAVLKQRIGELEKMEQHLKQQVRTGPMGTARQMFRGLVSKAE